MTRARPGRGEGLAVLAASVGCATVALLLIADIFGLEIGNTLSKIGVSALVLFLFGFLVAPTARLRVRVDASIAMAAVTVAVAVELVGAGAGVWAIWATPHSSGGLRTIAVLIVLGVTCGAVCWNLAMMALPPARSADWLSLLAAVGTLIAGLDLIRLIIDANLAGGLSVGLVPGVDENRLVATALVVAILAPPLAGAARRLGAAPSVGSPPHEHEAATEPMSPLPGETA